MLRIISLVLSCFSLAGYAQVSPEWVVRYVAEDSSYVHECTDLEVDDLGNILVAGFIGEPAPAGRVVLLKYSPTGSLEWERSINVVATDAQLEVDASGAAYLMYTYYEDLSNRDFVFTKYSSQGDSLFTGRYSTSAAPSSDLAYSVFLDEQGFLHMTGEHGYVGLGDLFEILTVVFDPTGQEVWHAFHNAGAHGVERGLGVGADQDGNTYVTGFSVDGEDSNLVVLKYDAAGLLDWERRHAGTTSALGRAIEVQGQRLIVGGVVSSPIDILCLGFSLNGDSLFEERFTAPWAWNAPDQINTMAVDDVGAVYIGGTACPGSGESDDYLVLKLDPEGEVLWHWRYNGGAGYDDARAIDHDLFGSTYVFGESRDSLLNTTVLLSVKLGAAGEVLWMSKYTEPSAWLYQAAAAELSMDGSFYAAGTEFRPDGTENFILLKYGVTVGVQERTEGFLHVDPNPSSGTITVDLPGGEGPLTVQILNAIGQQVLSWSTMSGREQFSMDGFPGGAYHLIARGTSYTGHTRFLLAR